MVTKLDVFLTISLYPGLSCADIVKKIGKAQTAYNAAYNLLQELKTEKLAVETEGKFSPSKTKKARTLISLVYFCFKNGIDYNKVVSEKAAEFIKLGLEKGKINGLPFDAKTVRRIVHVLSKNGFVIVESKKPFSCRIVPSEFIKLLAEYFFGKTKVKCPSLPGCLDEKLVDSKLGKHFSEYKALEKRKLSFDEIGFIYVSLSLEGNTLTLSETEKIIRHNIAPSSKPFRYAQQVVDYKKALDGFIFSGSPITEESILEFHRTAMNSLAAGAGKFRKENVRIKGNPDFRTPDWRELPALLKNFFKDANIQEKEKVSAAETVERAAFLHNEFQRIHPFIDGNSRTSRAIFLKALTQSNFPLIKLPVGFSDQYMKLTKLSKKRDDKKFALLMKQVALENLKHIVKKLEHEF
ncbi:Fic family protein [Candidatus Micrarchaeota archaeon]|nr:Fic family protein [Candidatus Micrarchaeota archaeon]MBU1940068.1 Fic family protein [Candidatus Micrarchaeota archaeon]